jgi:transcriptional regulator with XRE-family HTH domain
MDKPARLKVLRLASVNTNDAMKQRVRYLLEKGVSQLAIARSLRVSNSTVGRWLKHPTRELRTKSIDGLRQLENELSTPRPETIQSARNNVTGATNVVATSSVVGDNVSAKGTPQPHHPAETSSHATTRVSESLAKLERHRLIVDLERAAASIKHALDRLTGGSTATAREPGSKQLRGGKKVRHDRARDSRHRIA